MRTNRYPTDIKKVKSFSKDACRRDLTCNALGIDQDGVIYDYVGGIDDLKNKIIRTVGEPFKRFSEDALRLLRVGRFASKLGFKIEPNTLKAIEDLKHMIEKVAPERIKDELFKAAAGGGQTLATYIEHLYSTGLLNIIIPELAGLGGMEHPQEYHPEAPDVLGHILAALKVSPSKDPTVNMAILFHDIGKLTTQGKDGEKITYHGHDNAGVEIFENIAKRLKLSNEERDAIIFAIHYHMQIDNFPNMKKTKVVALRQSPYWPVLKQTMYADDMSRGSKATPEKFKKDMDYVEDMSKKFGEKQNFEKRMSDLVNGRMIMGMIPNIKGQDIGKIKDAARELIIQKDFQVSSDEVKTFIKHKAHELGYENP